MIATEMKNYRWGKSASSYNYVFIFQTKKKQCYQIMLLMTFLIQEWNPVGFYWRLAEYF